MGIFELILHRERFFDFCRGRVVVHVAHASGIFACRAYGLPPLEAELVIFGFALHSKWIFRFLPWSGGGRSGRAYWWFHLEVDFVIFEILIHRVGFSMFAVVVWSFLSTMPRGFVLAVRTCCRLSRQIWLFWGLRFLSKWIIRFLPWSGGRFAYWRLALLIQVE